MGHDALAAADNYRRAAELVQKARAELISAAADNRSSVNLRGLSRRAGLSEQTLYKWLRERNGNGEQ